MYDVVYMKKKIEKEAKWNKIFGCFYNKLVCFYNKHVTYFSSLALKVVGNSIKWQQSWQAIIQTNKMDVIETVCDDHFTLKYINKYFETNKGYSIKMYLGG